MGCSSSNSGKLTSFENRLYALCMKFNFDIHNKQPVTFGELFCWENCNELGQTFNLDSGQMLAAEFWKFLFLCASEICWERRSKNGYWNLNPIAFNDGTDFAGYESPLNAPPYIDRVWWAFICYDKQYWIACHMVAQGYIFWRDPR